MSVITMPKDVLRLVSPEAINLIGESKAINQAKSYAASAARRLASVMITGERGSGKEYLARYIHQLSERAAGPFIPVDCAAFSEESFESQLFGQLKTQSTRGTLGYVRAADGGTLFLDEVAELTPSLQALLLHLIQNRSVTPVGASEPQQVNIRLVCSTSRDLRALVDAGSFRADLYFRINVVCLDMPSLRQRREDILPLANFYIQRQAEMAGRSPCKLSEHAAESLMLYPWPGNVRELFFVLEHALMLADGDTIALENLPVPLNNFGFLGRPDTNDLNLDSVERRTIIEALKRTRYNRAAAARLLGIEARRLNRRVTTLKIPIMRARARA